MRQGQDNILQRIGKALHLHCDDITREPLPSRWVDLIQHLDEQERQRPHDDRPASRRKPSNTLS